MKIIKKIVLLVVCVQFSNSLSRGASAAEVKDAPIFRIPLTRITGEKTTFSEFKGKVVLVVNTASECGYTGQYKGLQELYQKFSDRGFVVLGFPSNEFGGQEPGANGEIKKFCETKFKVTFPLFEKTEVKSGPHQHPLYKAILGSKKLDPPSWNFTKYLINKNGEIVDRFGSSTGPESSALLRAIEGLLSP